MGIKGRKIFPPPKYDAQILIDVESADETDLLDLLDRNKIEVKQSARITSRDREGQIVTDITIYRYGKGIIKDGSGGGDLGFMT